MSERTPEIREIDFRDGEMSLGVYLPILPSSEALFIVADTSNDSREVLQDLIDHWGKLWPKILKKLRKEMKGYGVEKEIGTDTFVGFVKQADLDAYLGKKHTLFLRLEFDEPPLWDCFLKGSEVVHFQPVF